MRQNTVLPDRLFQDLRQNPQRHGHKTGGQDVFPRCELLEERTRSRKRNLLFAGDVDHHPLLPKHRMGRGSLRL